MVDITFQDCMQLFLIGIVSGVALSLLFSILGWTIYKLFNFMKGA